jgi:peptidyl-prolyl cis-trans isomerase D
MAVIGKIRQNSYLLLVVIGVAMLAFILTDFFNSRGQGRSDLENIGVVDGIVIKSIDFNNQYEKELENYKTRENRSDVPEFIQGQLRQQVWNQYLTDLLVGRELEELGITVSTEELGDMAYGDNPHPQVRQAFTNPQTGVFNKNDVINFLRNLDRDETGQAKNQWLVFERAMKQERKMNKYFALIQKGLHATTDEARMFHSGSNTNYDISYVVKRYNDIPDSTVKVTEDDIERYYDENRHKYKEDKSRKIEYTLFPILPSSEDSSAIREWVMDTYEEFKLTEDDSAFVNANSDKEFDFRFYSMNTESIPFDTSLFAVTEGGYMTEPGIESGSWVMSKVTKIKFNPDSVEARHILMQGNEENSDEVRNKLDSLKKAIEGGADFAEMAKQYSADPGSKEEGGNLGWFEEGFMIPVINDSCFKGEVNKLMLVESPFGWHLLEVTGKSEVVKKLQVAQLIRAIDASNATIDKQFSASNALSLKAESTGDLEKAAVEYNLGVEMADVKENDFGINQIPGSRGLVRWAFNAEKGDVSEAMEYGDYFVVAKLTEVHEDGIASLENVRVDVEIGATKEKKAQRFIEEMSGFSDLDEAATSLNIGIQRASALNFEAYSVPGLGREPEVVGKISTMGRGDLSVPIKGENGVYIVRVENVITAPEMEDYRREAQQLASSRASRVNYEVFEALKERVEIEDFRYRLY